MVKLSLSLSNQENVFNVQTLSTVFPTVKPLISISPPLTSSVPDEVKSPSHVLISQEYWTPSNKNCCPAVGESTLMIVEKELSSSN